MPDRQQWPSYQTVGERLFVEGWAGVLYAAAARPDSLALCVFRSDARLAGVRSVPPPVRHDEPPAPPRGLRAQRDRGGVAREGWARFARAHGAVLEGQP